MSKIHFNNVLKYFKNIYTEMEINENEIVNIYSSIEDEINSVKYGVGIYNRSESAVLHLKGNDVLNFIQRISTNDVLGLGSYNYVTTLFTNDKGRLIDRTVLVRLEEDFFLVGSKRNDAVLYRWLNKYIINEDVQNENKTGQYLILDVIGPQAESYLTLICGKEIDQLDNHKLHRIEIDNKTSYLLKKLAASGENLYWIISEAEHQDSLLDYLLSHKSVFDLSMVGEKAFDYYRVLNKVPKKPNEINDNFNPHEAGLIHEVSFTKGCYIGQEVIARLDTYDKVQKNIKKVRIEGIKITDTPIEFFNEHKELVGILTTLVKTLDNNHHEGLAFIRNSFQKKNEVLDVFESGMDSNTIKMRILD